MGVLSARPGAAETDFSFAGLADLLQDIDAEVLETLPAPQRSALEVTLLRVEPEYAPPGPRAVAAAVLGLLRGLAAREPLLVAVDDLHWLDAASAQVLAFAARRLRSDRVCFLFSRREGPAPALERAFAPTELMRLELGALSFGAVRTMLSRRLGLSLTRRVLRHLFETSSGNPLFALELARLLAERGPVMGEELPVPELVEELVGARVASLPPAVRRLLTAVALSPDLRREQLPRLADRDTIEAAVSAEAVILDERRVRPGHPLLAAAARTRATADELRALHRELAQVATDEELKARHLALAVEGPDPKLAARLATASNRAVSRGAVGDAADLAEHAFRLTPPLAEERPDRLLTLAERLLTAGEGARASELLSAEFDALPNGSARARAHMLLAESDFILTHVDDSGTHLRSGMRDRLVGGSDQEPRTRHYGSRRRADAQAFVAAPGDWQGLNVPTGRLAVCESRRSEHRQGGFSVAGVADSTERRDALVERLFMDAVGAFDLFSVYLGDRLGLYRIVAAQGAVTSAELAAAAGVHERYAREWLEQQAASELLEVDTDGNGGQRRFRLPEGHEEPLLDVSSLNYVAPMARAVLASIRPIDALLAAFRSGEGVPYADYGEDLHEAQAAFTRPLFENLLGKEWLPSVPELHERLLADPPARVADVACGQGRSSIEIARAYPKVKVDGIDSDHASVERARENLVGSGVENRVTFHERDAADAELAGRYDLVTIFEALHDMSYPVDVLRAARGLLGDDGVLFIGDERTEEAFTAPAGEVERLLYGFSVFHCLPVGMVGSGAAGTGTVIRAETVRRYAEEAGFAICEVLPIENDFWRFYLLRRP